MVCFLHKRAHKHVHVHVQLPSISWGLLHRGMQKLMKLQQLVRKFTYLHIFAAYYGATPPSVVEISTQPESQICVIDVYSTYQPHCLFRSSCNYDLTISFVRIWKHSIQVAIWNLPSYNLLGLVCIKLPHSVFFLSTLSRYCGCASQYLIQT